MVCSTEHGFTYNHISNDLETVIDDGANNQYHEDENETIYDKKEDKDTK